MRDVQYVSGDRGKETGAIQVLVLALAEASDRLAPASIAAKRQLALSLLARSAAHNASLATLNAPDPPLEVIALSVRNVFELFLRLKYLLQSDKHLADWLNESVLDKVQIYENALTLGKDSAHVNTIRAEIQRIMEDAKAKGLDRASRLVSVADAAREVGLSAEYAAFFKLYSKLVHPSSYAVHSATNADKAGWVRDILVIKLQVYAASILGELEMAVAVPADECLDAARKKLDAVLRVKSVNGRVDP